jgi:N-acetylglucosaminyldiphosphoundecaprenol N-acetyl-beta-D-mannosaminyltransferase
VGRIARVGGSVSAVAVPSAAEARRPRERIRIGDLWIDRLTFDEALDAIVELVDRGKGGRVFTPNVDHLVLAEMNPTFKEAYDHASLSLVDGQPILWASRLMGLALPSKISGSDLIRPLATRAAGRGLRVYLLGGAPGVADKAAEILVRETGVTIAGTSSPMISKDGDGSPSILDEVRAAKPHILLAALGSPKQEVWIHKSRAELGPIVAVGIGAGLDFITGAAKRAPTWISKAGAEWLFRLAWEPRRLWRRYLLMDSRFPLILARTMKRPRQEWSKTE